MEYLMNNSELGMGRFFCEFTKKRVILLIILSEIIYQHYTFLFQYVDS